jgi:hypothetical protein
MVPTAKANCELAVIGGGCPNLNECMLTCQPCYRGVGRITAFCRPAGGGIPFDQCICSFKKGAPCSPKGPPKCPRPPATILYINQTSDN